ncbi:MAG: hypothetical protein EZS28_037156, partial [Streblomastix strix]
MGDEQGGKIKESSGDSNADWRADSGSIVEQNRRVDEDWSSRHNSQWCITGMETQQQSNEFDKEEYEVKGIENQQFNIISVGIKQGIGSWDSIRSKEGGNQILQPIMDGNEKRKQMEKSARLQRTQQGNGKDSFQNGQCLVSYGFDATGNVCNDIRFEKRIQSHKGGRETIAIYGFPILGKGVQVHRDAIWFEPKPSDILQCTETSIERNQSEMENRIGELYRRYSTDERGLFVTGEGYIGNNRLSEQFGMDNGNGEMYDQTNERVRIHRLEMECRKIGSEYSLNQKKITEVENQELDEIRGIKQENTSQSDCISVGRAKFLEDLVSTSIITHAVDKQIESKDTQKRGMGSLVRSNEENSWELMWWKQQLKLNLPLCFEMKRMMYMMTTDASKDAWGATLEEINQTNQDQWIALGEWGRSWDLKSSNQRELAA